MIKIISAIVREMQLCLFLLKEHYDDCKRYKAFKNNVVK